MNLIPNSSRWLVRFIRGLALLLTVGASLALAQDAGTVTGRVQNAGNGKYLNNAQITIAGTNRETFTNEFGEYRLSDVPAGEVKVRAFFTGLDTEVVTVTVAPGQAAVQDFNLSSKERYGVEKPVSLDTFVVSASREFEGNAIATNEQRFSPNIKNVVAADAFGDVTEGNVGEFLKYLPGISVDYVAADVRTVSVRGFASQFTNVSVDGMRTTSSVQGNSRRVFEFDQISINNVARVEVVKVPTPDTPADSLGGNINMVSKNAFERKGVEFNYRAYLNASNEDLQVFRKTPGPANKSTYKALPGFDFDLAIPFNKRFGIVITGLSSNQFNEQHRMGPRWNFAQAGATQANPYLWQFQTQDGPKNTYRDSLGAKADWKITDTQAISLMVQENFNAVFFGNRNLNFNLGTNATPTPATGTALQFGPTFAQSATGRASVTQGGSFRHINGNTFAAALTYHLNGRVWDINTGVHLAQSRSWLRDLSDGHFSVLNTTMQGVSTVRVDNIAFPNLTWVAKDAAGTPLDYNSLQNYRVTSTRTVPADGKAWMTGSFVDVKRDFGGLAFPLALKVGAASREETKDNRRYQVDYFFVGADGVANTADDTAAPFVDVPYSTQDPHFGQALTQWGDPYLMADLFKAHPEYFREGSATTATRVPAETFRIANSQRITETVTAAYVQAEAKLFNNRLGIVTGVRFEKTKDAGLGALIDPDAPFVRNANGTFLDGSAAAGLQRVRKPEAGAAGSIEELRLTNIERAYAASRTYDGYYPSLHATFQLKENLQLRFSYARTLGRPDYGDIIPTATINDNENFDLDPTQSPGSITIANTGLKPWQANNYDLSLEYYFKKGGVASVGVFRKDLTDFWGNTNGAALTADLAQQLGLDPIYIGWAVTSKNNVGNAKITGVEFNYVKNLDFLPGWGRYFSINANATKLQLTGPNGTDFKNFIPKTANFSLSYNKKPFNVRVSWNYRGGQIRDSLTGAEFDSVTTPATPGNGNFTEYFAPRYNLDTNFEYVLSKRLRFFFNARNITNVGQRLLRYSLTSAPFAQGRQFEEFGIQLAAGIKGSF